MSCLKFKNKTIEKNRGIAIYIAITITAILVLVSFAVVNLAIKEVSISSSSRDSQIAFYSADSAVECTLYWDLHNSTNPGQSAFASTTPAQNIDCNKAVVSVTKTFLPTSGNATSTFSVTFPPNQNCANVNVIKSYALGSPTTRIESRGYNSCSSTNARRVERAILVNY